MAKTVDYINELRNTNAHLAESLKSEPGSGYDIQRMRQQISELTKENKILKQKLLENNIQIPAMPQQTQQQQAATVSLQQQHLAGNSSGQPVTFTTKRLIPVTMTPQGPVVIMSASEQQMSLSPDQDDDDDVMDS